MANFKRITISVSNEIAEELGRRAVVNDRSISYMARLYLEAGFEALPCPETPRRWKNGVRVQPG